VPHLGLTSWTLSLQEVTGTLKRDNLMGPAQGKTINDFQDDW